MNSLGSPCTTSFQLVWLYADTQKYIDFPGRRLVSSHRNAKEDKGVALSWSVAVGSCPNPSHGPKLGGFFRGYPGLPNFDNGDFEFANPQVTLKVVE
jgi:hypothetical protein